MEFYGDIKEDTPKNMPETRELPVWKNIFVDSDHTEDRMKRCSYIGSILILDKAPLVWYSKQQNTVEPYRFGMSFSGLRTAQYTVHLMYHKLIVMGILIDGESNVFIGNESVWKCSRRQEATIKNNNVSICFHPIRGAVANNVICVGFLKGNNNLATCLINLMPGIKKRSLFGRFMK